MYKVFSATCIISVLRRSVVRTHVENRNSFDKQAVIYSTPNNFKGNF